MDFVIHKIEILHTGSLSFTRGEVLQKYYPGYTVIDLGDYNQASGVWIALEKDGDQVKLEFRKVPYIIHHKLD